MRQEKKMIYKTGDKLYLLVHTGSWYIGLNVDYQGAKQEHSLFSVGVWQSWNLNEAYIFYLYFPKQKRKASLSA